MYPVGAELKQARERLGLSAEQIGQRTKVQLYKIEALENGNFDNLPDGIYLDGIVRAYADEVALDPEPLIDRVRADRAQTVEQAEGSFGDFDALFRQEPTSESPMPSDAQFEEWAPLQPPATAAPARDAAAGVAGARRFARRGALASEIEAAAARAGLEPVRPKRRLSHLALPLVALLAVAGWSAYFYEIARRPARTEPPAGSTPSTARVDDAAKKSAAAAPDARVLPAASERQSVDAKVDAIRESSGTAGTTMPVTRSRRDAPPKSPESMPMAAPAPPPTERASVVAPAGDVSGTWSLATRIESSSYSNFKGLNLGYDIKLQQAGDRITGSGRKVSENGAPIGSKAQTPISLAGTMAGDRVTLTFTEQGARRPTQGKFVLLFEEGGVLRGRFSSTAAQSSGMVEGRRVESR